MNRKQQLLELYNLNLQVSPDGKVFRLRNPNKIEKWERSVANRAGLTIYTVDQLNNDYRELIEILLDELDLVGATV